MTHILLEQCNQPDFQIDKGKSNAHPHSRVEAKQGHKMGITQKYSFLSYALCPATASCHDEQVFQVWY